MAKNAAVDSLLGDVVTHRAENGARLKDVSFGRAGRMIEASDRTPKEPATKAAVGTQELFNDGALAKSRRLNLPPNNVMWIK